MKLTSHERIMRIFQNREIDRPALKLWGAGFADQPQLHPDYQPISDLAAEISDLFITVSQPFDPFMGKYKDEYSERYFTDTADPTWKDQHTVFHTPKGDLHEIKKISTLRKPGYVSKHMIEEPEDIQKLLSLPYAPYPIQPESYELTRRRLGDRGVAMVGLDHAGYALHRLIGSENLAFFSMDCREELLQLTQIFAHRIYDHTKALLEAGLSVTYSWVGPELFLPPLMSPRDFHDMVYTPDKKLCDLIHNHGGYVWVHSHGKVVNFMDDFIDMGVDVLNPLEPPKNGDVDMKEIVSKYGSRIGLEGNIEIQDILQASPERLCTLIDECVEAGKDSGRFILCPSAGFMEYPFPTSHYLSNLRLYLRHGLQAVERCR